MSNNIKHWKIGSVPEGADARYVADLVRKQGKPLVFVANNDTQAAEFIASLDFFAPEIKRLEFPAWDCVPYDRISPNADINARRMACLAQIISGNLGTSIIVTSVNAITQKIPTQNWLSKRSFTGVSGRPIHEAKLKQYFAEMGFHNVPTVTEPGEFAIRGGLIDIFAPGEAGAIRLDLFGDVLETIRRFDPISQRTIESLDHFTLLPMSEVTLDADAIKRFRENYRTTHGAAGTDDPLYEAVSAGRNFQGVEHWLPYFHYKLNTFFDYLPDATYCFAFQSENNIAARFEHVYEQYSARQDAMQARAKLDTVYKPVHPDGFYLTSTEMDAILINIETRHLSPLPIGSGPNVLDLEAKVGRNFLPERQDENKTLFEAFAAHVRDRLQKTPVIIATYSKGSLERLKGLLEEYNAPPTRNINSVHELQADQVLHLAIWPLDTGFEAKDLTVISEQDVLGDRLIRVPKRKKRAENYITEATSLSVGDLVVHVNHGIGRYKGMEIITVTDAPNECLTLEYHGGDRLYLPVENIELLSRYGQETALLDKLGGGAWQAKKARLKERIREIADQLLRIAAERTLRSAPKIEIDPSDWQSFLARFPFTETEDQQRAIDDTLNDLTLGTPMDRLICGDVGFGKTEVALRAAFALVMSGYQVAIVAPTTLLARQHFLSFQERFRGTGVNVRQLSRMVASKEAEETRKGLANGSVDIVVGTHAVLAKGIRFQRLGLLVIDEEQKFGVTHKERLKQIKSDIHVLTLTATPIPRTLQLSLSGVRDLSIIGSPPIDRLAVRTYFSPFDAITIRDALLREFYRGGQSFYVVPRLTDLEFVTDFLSEQVPEISFVVAHGQMTPTELEERMGAFYDGKYGILVATSIIESGLDIPSANTLIVHRADMFGLAQLYQIRGRVGRSKLRAFAYLTTEPRKKLTQTAEKRLRLLAALDTLGAGFTIASQDMDLRGAGNLLGDEQSGHIKEVGYALYQEMLNETIAKLKTGEIDGLTDDNWSPRISLGLPVLIPDKYISDLDLRLGIYRRLSSLSKKIELEGFAAELIDRFGPMPSEVDLLLKIVRLKGLCRRAGIAKLDGGPKGAVIEFHGNKFINPLGIVDYIAAQKGTAKIKGNKLIIVTTWRNGAERLKGAYGIVTDLVKITQKTPKP